MQDVEPQALMQVEYRRGDRQIMGRGVEERVGHALGHVQLHPTGGPGQTRRSPVGEEVHLVPALGKRQGQLTGNNPRPPIGRVAKNPNLHPVSLRHDLDRCPAAHGHPQPQVGPEGPLLARGPSLEREGIWVRSAPLLGAKL